MHDLRDRREAASVKIESVARGRRARQLAEQMRKEQIAAAAIQKVIKGKIDRKYVKATREEKAEAIDIQRHRQEEVDCADAQQDVSNEQDLANRASGEVCMGRAYALF